MASLPTNAPGRRAAFTHLLALLAGIIIGKSIDADELRAYRSSSSSNDGALTRIRRGVKSFLVTGIVLGLIVKTGRMAIGGGYGGGGDDGGGGGGGGDGVKHDGGKWCPP
ncbi:hypothetical protein ACHAXA_000591 [Cyclostephanos tholiformis]|uniref:Uncharacterized protein n=1 Tax=Cyclostephanos tholiformis TaxID=382380 RepID=A0ABD3SQW3_9STRA